MGVVSFGRLSRWLVAVCVFFSVFLWGWFWHLGLGCFRCWFWFASVGVWFRASCGLGFRFSWCWLVVSGCCCSGRRAVVSFLVGRSSLFPGLHRGFFVSSSGDRAKVFFIIGDRQFSFCLPGRFAPASCPRTSGVRRQAASQKKVSIMCDRNSLVLEK